MPVYDVRFERALRLGGRLFAVVGSAPVMDAMLVRRVDQSEWIRESLFETVIDPLINATAAPAIRVLMVGESEPAGVPRPARPGRRNDAARRTRGLGDPVGAGALAASFTFPWDRSPNGSAELDPSAPRS